MKKFKEIIQLIEEDFSKPLNEAAFSATKVKKVADLLAGILGKDLGGEFKLLGGSFGKETFKKPGIGEGRGLKYMNQSGKMIRFGWLKKSKSKYQINQVDFWDPHSGATWDKPSISITLADWMNIVDVVNELKQILIHGDITESLEESFTINEWNVPKKMIQYAKEKGVEFEGESGDKFTKKLIDAGVWDEEEYRGYKVVKNQKESNSTSETIKASEKLLKQRKTADPDVVFEDIEKLTKVVAMGLQNGLIVAGMAGIGKCLTGETEIPVKGL